jgi:hypothetical protein
MLFERTEQLEPAGLEESAKDAKRASLVERADDDEP